ncbi:MAG: glutamine synthetase III [Erysipelotrichaceae bacterium]
MKAEMIEMFGSKCLTMAKLKKSLSPKVYGKYKEAVRDLMPLDLESADEIASVVKAWAIEEGVTHYTHWFQPMTGATAKKHESFLEVGTDATPLLQFRGKDLIKGEPDASSFPNGGLRATFEARGYTYWDITSQIFIRDNVLYIPTIFVSFYGDALDKKLPLLRSIGAVNQQATRVLHLLGYEDVKCTKTVIGLEQEYFLVDRNLYLQRPDLINCGKTLFGMMAPKGQEMEDHYFGSIPTRVEAFMKDVNEELWKLGVFAKTEHNEVAPTQFELAPIFGDCNISIDQNLLMMEILQKVALQHDLVCLLHEKPYAGVNGSGKHTNFSLATNTGLNVFAPGHTPYENKVFLLFVSAMIAGVDTYPELLRMSSSGPGNDERLGASEAPPAVISMFLGSDIEGMLEDIEAGAKKEVVKRDFRPLENIKDLPSDACDRNRTSPMAFTGNKFEFRMVGSSRSAATTTTVLNLIMAKALEDIIVQLESKGCDLDAVYEIVKATLKQHKRVIFGGDGYAPSWIEEATRRGLPNITTYFASLACLSQPHVIDLYERFHVLTKEELLSRQEINYEELNNTRLIEAKTMLMMLNTRIIPDVVKQVESFKRSLALFESTPLQSRCETMLAHVNQLIALELELETRIQNASGMSDAVHKGKYILQSLQPLMAEIRSHADASERYCDSNLYSLPSYGTLFQSIR